MTSFTSASGTTPSNKTMIPGAGSLTSRPALYAASSTATSSSNAPAAPAEGPASDVWWRAALIFFRLMILGILGADLNTLIPVVTAWRVGATANFGPEYVPPVMYFIASWVVLDFLDALLCIMSIAYTIRPDWRTNSRCCKCWGPYRTDMICDMIIFAYNLGGSIMATAYLRLTPEEGPLTGWMLTFLPLVTIAISMRLAAMHMAAAALQEQSQTQQQRQRQHQQQVLGAFNQGGGRPRSPSPVKQPPVLCVVEAGAHRQSKR